MTYSLSTSALETLDLAKAGARRLQNDRVSTGHLLIALSYNEDILRHIFRPLRVTRENIRGQVREVLSTGHSPDPAVRPLTADFETVLDLADKSAFRLDDEFVWPAHLLIALTEFQCSGQRALIRCGADLEAVDRLARGVLQNTPPKEPMDLTVTDTSAGRQNLTEQATRTARVLVPRDHQPGREVVLQATVVNAPLEENCKAVAAVLNDQFAWTELLSLPVSEWRDQVPLPDPHAPFVADALTGLADDLLARASRILAA
jgi:ATP-dependent Clp protease ATP-binding subunit ClpA